MTEDIILYLELTPHFKDTAPTVKIDLNNSPITVPTLIRDTMCRIEYLVTLKLGDPNTLTIQLLNKTQADNIYDQNGNIIISHGLVINSIAVGWPINEQDQLFIEFMSGNKGSEDNTNRTDPEYEKEAEIKKQQATSTSFSKFPLNHTMIKRGCRFSNPHIAIQPTSNRIFKIFENGQFKFNFTAPFAYWALENFI
jgi:hypothetical protein